MKHIYLTEDIVQLHVRPWYEGPIHSGLLEQIAAIIARYDKQAELLRTVAMMPRDTCEITGLNQ